MLRHIRSLLAVAYRADFRGACWLLALYVVQATASPLQALWLKMITDGVVNRHPATTIVGSALLALFMVVRGLGLITAHLSFTMSDKVMITLNRHIADVTQRIPELEHYERPEYHDRLVLLREDVTTLPAAVTGVGQALMVVVQLSVTSALLASVHPAMLGLVALAFGWVSLARHGEGAAQRARESAAPDIRLENHLTDLALSPRSVKELRVFALGAEISTRAERLWRSASHRILAGDVRSALLNTLGVLIFTAGVATAVVGALALAIAGRATAGDVVLVLNVSVGVLWQVGNLAVVVNTVSGAVHGVERLRRLEEISDQRIHQPAHPAEPPQRLATGIQIRHLSFSYPGTNGAALAEVNLDIPAGSTVALIGENGAGKTTFVKLLCGFYTPSTGQIMVDGVPLDRIPTELWRRRVTGTFQDFVSYELRVRESVGQGDITRIDDDEALGDAVRGAGAQEVVVALPEQLDTQLGRRFGGAELSGGQAQRIALARGFMRSTPLLQVLDEPTATLDPDTEYALFDRYSRSAAGASATTGAITLLVSHRFSTIQLADLIIVIRDGRFVEIGTHDELMMRNGVYAELYRLSARAYER